jgi:hypothetical protein
MYNDDDDDDNNNNNSNNDNNQLLGQGCRIYHGVMTDDCGAVIEQ